MRKEAKLLIGDNLKAELAPFSFKHRDGGEFIQEAPMVYVPNLWMKIKDQMNQNSDKNDGKEKRHSYNHALNITMSTHFQHKPYYLA